MNKPKPKTWYYKILQVAKTELGMDEDTYRDTLYEFGARERNGRISASTMTIPQLERALAHMQKCGFKIKRKKTTANFKDGQLAKCEKLWRLLHTAGVMRQPYSEGALSKFAYRMTKVNNITWANSTGLAKTIEALKGIAQRERVAIDQ